ncbi:MAG: peptidoglycan-binding domain-containing protein [Luteolibacter sp.]
MKQYLLPAIAGILALSANLVVAAPRGKSPEPPRKVESKGPDHGKPATKSYSKAPVKPQIKGPVKGHSSWNDRIEVRAQRRLQALGFYRGAIDGDFGRGSRAALVKFQRGKHLRPTGVLDAMTIRALGI